MQFPPFLKQGDTVGIIATARSVEPQSINRGVEWLSSHGLKVKFGKNLFSSFHQFGGDDTERLSDLQWALDDKDLKAIWVARGGYGTLRILDRIDFTKFSAAPKWLIGFSDVTALHSLIQKKCKIATLHAPMPFSLEGQVEALKKMRDLLFGDLSGYDLKWDSLNKMGKGTGILVGGNLSLLYALSGTFADIDTRDKILFIEDVDEYLYHLDRMILNLKFSGKLSHLNGLVCGGFSNMKDHSTPFGMSPQEIILDAVKEFNYPVCFGFSAGHLKPNFPLVLGGNCELIITASNCHLRYV